MGCIACFSGGPPLALREGLRGRGGSLARGGLCVVTRLWGVGLLVAHLLLILEVHLGRLKRQTCREGGNRGPILSGEWAEAAHIRMRRSGGTIQWLQDRAVAIAWGADIIV